MLRRVVKAFLYFLCLIVYRVKKVNESNIPKEGSYIICANHVHALDAPVMVLASKRKIQMIAKEELFENPILAWLRKFIWCNSYKKRKGRYRCYEKGF